MAWIAATASDYAEAVKQYNKDAQGVSDWERYFLQPTQQAFETAASQVQQQTQYDISGAYANYLKTQRNIAQQSQLGTGFKEQVSQQLRDQYSSAFEQAKTEEAQQLTELQTEYQDILATNEEALLKQGEQLASLEQAIYNYAGVDTSKLGLSVEQGGLGYYTTDESGVTTLTDRGKAFFDEQLNTIGESGTSFSDWLYQTDSELYDFYTSNPDLAKQLIGGLESGDVKFTDEERIKNEYNNYIKSDIEWDTLEEESAYLSGVKEVVDIRDAALASFEKGGWRNSEEWKSNIENVLNKVIPDYSSWKDSFGPNASVILTTTGISATPTIKISTRKLTDEAKKIFEDMGLTEKDGYYNYVGDFSEFVTKLTDDYLNDPYKIIGKTE